MTAAAHPPRGQAYLVGVQRDGARRTEVEQHLDELARLADTAGFAEVGRAILPRRTIHPATFVGRGQAREVGLFARGLDATLVILDEELSPAQSRNLEKTFDLPVVDRAGLIIDIFAERAQSREARTQVEIAQLEYLLPRLAGRWSHLSRQVGGGPGGTKGEGEKQIELDRRMVRRRIARLRRDLQRMIRGRDVRRRARRRIPQAALVGYTNVGKSSLFNALASARAGVEDRLFATLDPTVRRVPCGARGELLLKDTVGLIRKLPHHLVASFRSTFEEAGEADLLIDVRDAAQPAERDQSAAVEAALAEGELDALPRLVVYNKIDLVSPARLVELRTFQPGAHFLSARSGEGVAELRELLGERLLGGQLLGRFEIPLSRADLVERVAQMPSVESWVREADHVVVGLRATRAELRALERSLAPDGGEVEDAEEAAG